MTLADADRELVVGELGREPTREEAVLFENLWSEHCAYRSSWPLLGALDSEGERVVVGPGDDAAVVSLPGNDETYVTLGIESHNHPSYVDPFDGAATGVGGIVRDTLSMGAYPIGLADSLYFGEFDRDHSQYLFEGVVEGISHYGNCIGVPTVAGSVAFHEDYEGNPLVNVACVGLTNADRLVTAEAQSPGNKLLIVGNATGRDGLGGASFASEDLDEDSETEDRPAVQVGDPYTEKLLIEANEQLIEEGLIQSARDLGAAGLGGATSELLAKGGYGADIELDRVHQREPNMSALEILLAESQERMCYEVVPDDVERVREIADRFDLGCSVIGEVTEGNYVCTFGGEARSASNSRAEEPRDESREDGRRTVVDVDAEFLEDGAPFHHLPRESPSPPERSLPDVDPAAAVETVLASPNTASKRWVYRQYDHEVGVRTATGPGDDAALLAIRETANGEDDVGTGLALSAGADPNWTDAAPYEGGRAVVLENATNVAVTGATPLAAVDCLNGGNPENPTVFDGFAGIVDGLGDACEALSVPVVGGNVSLYNDSPSGPIPPTPTVAMVGTRSGYDAPPTRAVPDATYLLVGEPQFEDPDLGGSELLAQAGGSDHFPTIPDDPAAFVETLADVATGDTTVATHDVSHGGLAVTLAELVTEDAGIDAALPDDAHALAAFGEGTGRAVVGTTDPDAVRSAFEGVAPVTRLGEGTDDPRLSLTLDDDTVELTAEEIRSLRSVIEDRLG